MQPLDFKERRARKNRPRDLNTFLWRLLLLLCLLLFLAVSPYLEASLIGHMLVQIPLLIIAGACAGRLITGPWRDNINRFNDRGIPGIVLAALAFSFWMVPKSLDAALTDPLINVIKYLSVPLLIGTPLSLGWPLMGFVGRSFVTLNAAAMLMAVGYLYSIAPVRLCNAYLIDQQAPAGYILIIFSGVLLFAWFSLFGRWHKQTVPPSTTTHRGTHAHISTRELSSITLGKQDRKGAHQQSDSKVI